jgi:hypothetical protein
MQVNPFHSKHKGTKRYHTSNKCGPGSEIPPTNRIKGTGGLKHCTDCMKLNSEGR